MPEGNPGGDNADGGSGCNIAGDPVGSPHQEPNEQILGDSTEPINDDNVSQCTLYLPAFYDNVKNLSTKELGEKDWITEDLLREIQSCLPSPEDVGADGKRDPGALRRNCEKLFPVGRTFASFKQIHQSLKEFGKAWGFVVSFTGGKL